MSQFSLVQRWLRDLFPPSVAPGGVYPGVVSDDVSLVHQWISGFELQNAEQWFTQVDSAGAGATGTLVMRSVANNEIGRVIAVSAISTAGGIPTSCNVRLTPPGGTVVAISPLLTITAFYQSFGALTSPIVPPGYELEVRYEGGDVNTTVRARSLVAIAPLGTSWGA